MIPSIAQGETMATQTQSFLQGEVADGKYDLRQYLGGSDHGAVFLTECGGMRRHEAAIKLVPARPGSAEPQLSRWRLAANLSHPHLLKIFDMGRCDIGNSARLYAVMERADENLAEIIPERALTSAEVRDMLAPVLDALAFLHSRGFVHSRVRPSNIMAVGEELKLSSDTICRLGESGEGVGPASPYDPPEGTRTGASPAGDVWSLGMTLCEILTQHLPAWNPAERKEPALPENLPAPFVDIVRHCLRREPKSRWTIADIAAHIPERIAETPAPAPAPLQAAPVRTAPAKKAPASTRRYAIGVAAAAIVIVAIVGGAKLFQGGPAQAPPISVTANARAEQPSEARAARPAAPKATEPEKPAPVAERVEPPKAKPVEEVRAPAPERASVPPPSPARVAANAQPATAESVRGEVLQQVLPTVPQKSSDTISGTVRVGVKVSVDASGNVTNAQLDSPGPSHYFANLSLQAARGWKFTPATANGENVASEWLLRFGYTSAGPKVLSTQALR